MHMLQIVHRDIKPANIMYSPTHQRNVFIDFGCTEFIGEELGQKSLTVFKGTTGYCTKALYSLSISQKRKGLIDLYENDVHALGKSIE
jgi:serine/threonine protein kinase